MLNIDALHFSFDIALHMVNHTKKKEALIAGMIKAMD